MPERLLEVRGLKVQFATEDGITLRGWLYRPDEGGGPYPVIVMAHGFSATREMHLEEFAEVFADVLLAARTRETP